MVLKDILAISGEAGLFRFIAQGKSAIIVEHLGTGKRSSAFGSSKVSSLEDIAIFTVSEDVPLSKVFDAVYEKHNGAEAVDPKSDPAALKTWFAEVLPDYDRDRVYVSDIRKVALWYNILHKLNLLIKEEPEKADEAPASAEKPENGDEAGKKARGKKKAPAPGSGKK